MRAGVAAASVLLLAACKDEPKSVRDAGTAPSADVLAVLAPADATPLHPASPTAPGCRVLGVAGEVSYAPPDSPPAAMHLGSTPPPRTWLDVKEGAKLQTKDPTTGRELAFEGPGRVQPCRVRGADEGRVTPVAGPEEAWVARGAFASSPGSGEAPGQEQWIVTPLAVIRYAAAGLKVTVGADVETRVAQGAAWIWLASGAKSDGDAGPDADGWVRLDHSTTLTASPKAATSAEAAARAGAGACTAAAGEARDLARAISAADGGPALGDLAVRHVVARRRARAACAVAGVRVSSLPKAPATALLETQVASAEEAWRDVAVDAKSDAGGAKR